MGSGKFVDVTWKTTLDESDLYDIVESYAEGDGIVELARRYRVRTSVINAVLADNVVPPRKNLTASTPIECRLHDALMTAGIGFTTQKRHVGRYVVDISINQAPVIIEADGARHRSGTAAERDEIRDVAHEAAGYRVFRFSGSEINADSVACVERVIAACGLVPDEDPRFDIRTTFSGEDHPRYVGFYKLTCGYCGETFLNRRRKRKYCCHEHYILGAVKGKPKSAEHRAKIGAASRRVQTPETRAKISAAKAGVPLTPEHRAKISAANRAHRANQIMRESDLRGDAQRPAEMTGPATLF